MKNLYYVFFLTSIHNVKLSFIQNQYKPLCANCKFFIPNKNECRKFGDIDIITGKYSYEQAISVRNDNDKCGEYAFFFQKNDFKFITIPYYFLLENSSLFFSLTYGFLPFILFYFLFVK
jgi:hypothetical protein